MTGLLVNSGRKGKRESALWKTVHLFWCSIIAHFWQQIRAHLTWCWYCPPMVSQSASLGRCRPGESFLDPSQGHRRLRRWQIWPSCWNRDVCRSAVGVRERVSRAKRTTDASVCDGKCGKWWGGVKVYASGVCSKIQFRSAHLLLLCQWAKVGT